MSLRKITVGDLDYRWIVSKSKVVIYSPSNEGPVKHAVSISDVTGRTLDAVERGRWKKTSDGMVTPRQVAKYIEKLLEEQ